MSTNDISVFDLSLAQKLQLVEELWDDIAAQPNSIPVYEWQKDELDRRKADLTANSTASLSWDEVKRRVRANHGR